MKTKLVAIDEVIPYERNPRINADAVNGVAQSLQEFGWRQPIVVDSDMVIIAGHTRLLAAQQLGWDKVLVHIASDLTPEQVKAYRIADNKTGEAATWNEELLKLEFLDLKAADFDLAITGFDEIEIQKIVQAVTVLPPAEVKTTKNSNQLSTEQPSPFSFEPGDVFVFNNHELMAGHEDRPMLKKIMKFIHTEWPDMPIERNGEVLKFED